jgi:hypothetical protein
MKIFAKTVISSVFLFGCSAWMGQLALAVVSQEEKENDHDKREDKLRPS